jgi:ABC-2 type transport system ATP-binding protein
LNSQIREMLEGHIDVLSVEDKPEQQALRVTLNDNAPDGSFIPEMLIKAGYRLTMLKEEEINLENVFMEITKGITN